MALVDRQREQKEIDHKNENHNHQHPPGDRRITYQAAPGEKVVLKGSEPLTGWKQVRNDTWKAEVPNRFSLGR